MSVFQEIKLPWEGKVYIVPPDQVMMCIAKVEAHITLVDLNEYGQRGAAPLGRLSIAYATALRHAGARVSDEEVYASLFKAGDMANRVAESIGVLLMMMIPPDAVAQAGEVKGKVAARGGAASPSSRRRTRSR